MIITQSSYMSMMLSIHFPNTRFKQNNTPVKDFLWEVKRIQFLKRENKQGAICQNWFNIGDWREKKGKVMYSTVLLK